MTEPSSQIVERRAHVVGPLGISVLLDESGGGVDEVGRGGRPREAVSEGGAAVEKPRRARDQPTVEAESDGEACIELVVKWFVRSHCTWPRKR
jgi:hypothetical protein